MSRLVWTALTGIVLAGASPAWAQSRAAADVAARLMSFDRNGDVRVTRDELPERMQAVIDLADKNQDGLLNSDEINRMVVETGASQSRTGGFILRPDSREGLSGVVSDLRLPQTKHDQALTLVSGHKLQRDVNHPANADLYAKMRELLDDEEYENFVAAAARLNRQPTFVLNDVIDTLRARPAPDASGSPRKE